MSSPTDWDSWRKVLVYCRLDLTNEDHRKDREDRNSHFGPAVEFVFQRVRASIGGACYYVEMHGFNFGLKTFPVLRDNRGLDLIKLFVV